MEELRNNETSEKKERIEPWKLSLLKAMQFQLREKRQIRLV